MKQTEFLTASWRLFSADFSKNNYFQNTKIDFIHLDNDNIMAKIQKFF